MVKASFPERWISITTLGLFVIAGCATGTSEVRRADWVLAPARAGGSEVLSREEYTAELAQHRRRRAPSTERIPPPLLDQTGPVQLHPGQVLAFLLVDEPVREMRRQGDAVQVFWTNPYTIDRMERGLLVEHRGADVYLRGASPGESVLQLRLTDGSVRTLRLEVSGHPTG
jgi:hypothetical protein